MPIQKLIQLLGSPEMAARFIGLFKSQMPEQLASLQTAADHANWQEVSITAHAIKGQIAYLEAEDLRLAAYQLEQDAEKGQATNRQIADFIQQVEAMMMDLPEN
jgi:HPt (histidine-containing phosphotransfer) domain-containing protein